MAKRKARAGAERPRRRVGVFSLAILAVLGAAGWLAPAVLVHTSLRDRPLEAAFAGIDGTIRSRSARWTWLSGIEYRDIVLADRAGQPAVVVPSLVIEKGLLSLAADPSNLGTVRLSGVEAMVAVRPGGSSLEDILAPWLAASAAAQPVACELELVGSTVELIDTLHADAWRVSDLFAAGSLAADGVAGWTAAGRVQHAGRAAPGTSADASPPAPAAAGGTGPSRLDRTTIPAAAAAALAREGGWSVSAPPPTNAGRSLAITTHRLPLGISSVVATRFESPRLADGLADVRLDLEFTEAATEVAGRLEIDRLAICRSDTLEEEFAIERCEVPLDVVMEGGKLVIRELRAVSPVLEAEASGRLPLGGDDLWQWLEQAVAADCSVAARIDLAAAARSLPGGLTLRPEVSVTGGSLQLAAIARADGADRVLEVRLDARNLAAVQKAAAAADAADAETADSGGERPLRWSEPFTGWLKGRRGPGREADLRIEEARLTSQAAELSVSGTPAALRAQWTVDLEGLVGELAELVDLGGMRLGGKARGRLDAERGGGGVTAVKLAASVADFELANAAGTAWKDDLIAVDAELVGSLTGSLAAIDRARGMLTAAGDTVEVTLAGGVLIDTAAVAGVGAGQRASWVRPAAAGGEVSADCSLAGDLGRWYQRLAAVVPTLAADGLAVGGSITAAAAVTPEPAAGSDAWRITKASGAVERFVLRFAGRSLAEPRIVATAAGILRPATGQVEISSAELLSSSLSLRSGGAAWLAGAAGSLPAADPLALLLAQVRGRVQWQADLARLEGWIVPRDVADRWPLAGRAWGTLDVAETQLGVNLVAEATGSQVSVSRRQGQGEPQPVWREPQATVAVELTQPFARRADGQLGRADRLVIDRLAVESSTLAVAARGAIEEWSARRRGELTGSLSYDWAQLSRLFTPWTGGRLRLAGAVNRPFSVRAALGEGSALAVQANAAKAPAAGTLPLPEAWLAATRGGDAEPVAERPQPSVPVTPTAAARRLDERLTGLSLETSLAWTAADLDGFPLAAGDLAIRLVEGQLALGPFDLAASGGRLRGAPWWKIAPLPGELVVPPGRLVDRVQLSGTTSNRLVTWISPLLAQATDTSAVVSLDVAGARLPLSDAFGGEAAGQVMFEAFEVRPSGLMQPLVNLLGKLQAAVDPRFALSDRPVLLRVRPEPIRVRLAERRIWHEGLVMDSGQFTVASRGSVAADGSLAMLVEVALRGDLAGQTPVVAQLLRTPIAIPLKGTLARPQFDAGAIDVTVKRILENTARAVVDDGIGRGLEALFGRPPAPPPGPPAPLTLPR